MRLREISCAVWRLVYHGRRTPSDEENSNAILSRTPSHVPSPNAGSDRPPVPSGQQKILFAKSGNLCAFPGCSRKLVEPETVVDDAAVIGHIAHIVAASRQGPRGVSDLTDEQRSHHSNLILFCRDHHGIVDAQPRTYSVQVLRQMRADHEKRVATALSPLESPVLPKITERLYSSLLPITHLPSLIFAANTPYTENQYQEAKQKVRQPRDRDILTAFSLRDGRLFTFYDMRSGRNPFRALVSGPVSEISAREWLNDAEGARRYKNLLNRTFYKLMGRHGVRYDPLHRRYYFEPKTVGKPREVSYRLQTGSRSTRKVVWQPITRATGQPKNFWIHLAARLSFEQVAANQWCLAIRPERRITSDGEQVLESKRIGRRVTRLKAKMYNDKYLGELYLWLSVLTRDQPRLVVKLGGQSIVIDARLVPFKVEWPGVDDDAPDKRVKPVEEDLFSLFELEEAIHGRGEIDEEDEETEEEEGFEGDPADFA